jgi:release factor glutamine methyltransferase
MTVLEVLQASTDYFRKRQIESARLNAEHLLAQVLGRKRIELYLEFDRTLTESELSPLRELVRRRGEGEPLQHLIGTVEFCGHVFVSDKRGMVPRPETEELVELVIAKCGPTRTGSSSSAALKILDVGTGSGVIALSLAAKLPGAHVRGVDISEGALALARENAGRLNLGERVEFSQGNLLENFTERFDVIVANLPYIAMADRISLSPEVQHDPDIALFGGEQGDEVIRKLIAQAPERLVPGGLLALEIGETQSDSILDALIQKKYKDMETKNDYSGRPRFVLARYG